MAPLGLNAQVEIMLYLALAMTLSGIIGYERERREKDAGLRTHMLVGMGACLFTAISYMAFPEANSARVAANVVTGVGFLGAGIIYHKDRQTKDLTTAASIWTTAALGMTVGVGAWVLAVALTVLLLLVLAVLRLLPVRDE